MLSLSNCGTVAHNTAAEKITPEQASLTRAQARWDALLKGDIGGAYEFISPAGRLTLPLSEYRLRINPQYWRSAKAKSATCEAEICEVKLDFDYELNGLKLSQVITEKWILDGGKWWFVYRG
jgi:hypothetical protein